MLPSAQLLIIESGALAEVLAGAPPADFDRPTVCAGWSVRDVLAHCAAALTATAGGNLHGFTPEDNQRDVDERRAWSIEHVLAELRDGYRAAAAAINAAGGRLDGIAVGEWIHGGDVRDALEAPAPYASAGVELAIDLLGARSRRPGSPRLVVIVDGHELEFGDPASDGPPGRLVTDAETFVRLCAGREPDAARFDLRGADPGQLILFA